METLENSRLHDIVSALAYSFAQSHQNFDAQSPPFNDLTRFILQQAANLPDFLQTPTRLATLGFDILGRTKAIKPFRKQTPEQRARIIAAWKNSRLGVQRDLMRYYESLAKFALYSRRGDFSQQTVAIDSTAAAEKASGQVLHEPHAELRAEFVVIGSGPGGAITACLLAEAGRDVLLIEEGPFLPLQSCEPFSREEMLQKYRCGGQTVAMGKNKIAYVEGRCVGGGSEINSGLYHRTPPDILERWRKEFQVEALAESDLEAHFASCERDLSVSLLPCPAPPASLRLHEGAVKLGWKSLEVPRWFRYEPDSTNTAAGSFSGKRQSMTQTYVPRFLSAGGRILPRTRAQRIRQNGSGWFVEAAHETRGALQVVTDNLFLCAGAVQSPALLRRSGITRNIGNSFQVHPTAKVVAHFSDDVNSADMGVPVHQVKEFSPRLSFGCSISSPAHLALSLLDHPEIARDTANKWRRMAVYYAMITSEGRGTIRPLPGFRDPLVRYELTLSDRRNLADGVRKLSELLLTAGARSVYPSIAQAPVLHCEGCLKKLPDILPDGMANLMTIHLFSSCPMGENKKICATDSFGRVHGFRNLFVNDASLLCTAPGVNPQGSIMALARRNVMRKIETTKQTQ